MLPRPFSYALVLIAGLVALQGCAVSGGGGRRVGGSRLSEAVHEAHKDNDGPKEVLWAGDVVEDEANWFELIIERALEPESEPDLIVTEDGYEVIEPHPLGPPPSLYDSFHFGAVAGFGMPASRDFGGSMLAGVQAGLFPFERARIDGAIMRAGATFSNESGLRQSFMREQEWLGDLSARYYFTPEGSAVGIYPVGGVQLGLLTWQYVRPVYVEDYGVERVPSDYITYFSPYIGLGASLVQTRHFHFGLQLVGGGRFFDTHTGHGLENDVFKDDTFWQLRVEMTAPL